MVSVGYISSCSSLNFFNLINLCSGMGIPYQPRHTPILVEQMLYRHEILQLKI